MILEINIMKIKKTKRWVIYKEEIDASKISADWYSWIHFMKNKIEFNTKLKNTIGKNHIYQIKLEPKMLIIQIKIMLKLKKNIKFGRVKFLFFFIIFFLIQILVIQII